MATGTSGTFGKKKVQTHSPLDWVPMGGKEVLSLGTTGILARRKAGLSALKLASLLGVLMETTRFRM